MQDLVCIVLQLQDKEDLENFSVIMLKEIIVMAQQARYGRENPKMLSRGCRVFTSKEFCFQQTECGYAF
jgi:hypothetical protein